MIFKIEITVQISPVSTHTRSDSNQSAIQLPKDPRCSQLWLECQNPACAQHGCLNELMNIDNGGEYELH